MNHVREWLLEADVADLQAPPATIAQHLAQCAECRAAHEKIVTGYGELDRGLDALRMKKTRRWAWYAPPIAAAAMLALLLTHKEEQPKAPTMLAQLMFRPQPIAVPQNGKQAVVMEHNGVTVIWLTNTQGQQ